jgi:hypothetical protein
MKIRELSHTPIQYLYTHLAFTDFAQRSDSRFIFAVITQVARSISQLTRAVSGRKRKLKAIWNIFNAIFDSDTGHEVLLIL